MPATTATKKVDVEEAFLRELLDLITEMREDVRAMHRSLDVIELQEAVDDA